jgi:hypothetical protein
MTGLAGLSQNAQTGLLQQAVPDIQGFGIAQNGKDLPGVGISGLSIWEGESPQYVGLDQVNAYFGVCPAKTLATTEKRYDAFLEWSSIESAYMTVVRIYLPFLVAPGDPDCSLGWGVNTATTVTSSVNPSAAGQLVTFTANVSPPTTTGTVTFFDGTAPLGSGTLSSGMASGQLVRFATYSTSVLSVGTHSITATYNGDSTYGGSSATRTQTVTAH